MLVVPIKNMILVPNANMYFQTDYFRRIAGRVSLNEKVVLLQQKGSEEREDLREDSFYPIAVSGEIMEMEGGVSMPVRQLFEYAILYSDNIAWMQIYYRFGYDSFYNLMSRLGVQGTNTDFMDLVMDVAVRFFDLTEDDKKLQRSVLMKLRKIKVTRDSLKAWKKNRKE